MLIGSLLLLALSVGLVAFGWSRQTALQGSLWGALLVAVIYTLAASMGAGELRARRSDEMCAFRHPNHTGRAVTAPDKRLFPLENRRGASTGYNGGWNGFSRPALDSARLERHLYRTDHQSATRRLPLHPTGFSSPELESAYRGQTFFWRAYPGWNQAIPTDWLRWSLLREMPQGQENIILWVRNDIFVNSKTQTP